MSTPPRLLDQVRAVVRTRGLSGRTAEAYTHWIRRYILFHGKRHPRELGRAEIEAFLAGLATAGRVATSTQNQALAALLFLVAHVLAIPLARGRVYSGEAASAGSRRALTGRGPPRAGAMSGVTGRMAALLYGAGLRLLECARLRVKDVDLERAEITIRDGKGQKDRRTMLRDSAKEPLQTQLAQVKRQHELDLETGAGWVELPGALDRKYVHAGRE